MPNEQSFLYLFFRSIGIAVSMIIIIAVSAVSFFGIVDGIAMALATDDLRWLLLTAAIVVVLCAISAFISWVNKYDVN